MVQKIPETEASITWSPLCPGNLWKPCTLHPRLAPGSACSDLHQWVMPPREHLAMFGDIFG